MTEPSAPTRARAGHRRIVGLPVLRTGAGLRTVTERLERLDASTPARWGSMSAGAMLRHLEDAFRVMYGERGPTRGARNGGRRRLRRLAVKLIALYLPAPWPKGLRTLAAIDQDRDGTPPGDFEADRAALLRLIERVAAGDLPTGVEHPFLGRLTAWEWQRWAYLHVDHHLRQFGR